MTKNMNIQPTGVTNVHKCNLKRSLSARIKLALAGTSVAGALLVGSLFGVPAVSHALQSGTEVMSTSSFTSSSMQGVDVAYNTGESGYRAIAYQAAVHAGIDPHYFIKQIQQESGFNPQAVSPAGAQGIAQFMPATAASLGVDPWNPTSALYGAAHLMANLKAQFGGNYAMALAGYNAGPGAVQYAIRAGGNNWYSYLPTETRNYVAVIMGW